MQIPTNPIRSPSWVSTRRILEQKLADLQKSADLNQQKQVHALIYRTHLQKDPFVAPKLITSLAICRQIGSAIKVFDQVRDPNVHLYNTLIRAQVQSSVPAQAFDTFFQMQKNGVSPDNFTYPFLLKACSCQSWLKTVRMIHAHVEKFGLYCDVFVPNSLIDAYSKCGVSGVVAAKEVFDAMEVRDTVSWNSLMGVLVKAGEIGEARKMFDEMPEKDRVSWNTILDGYVKAGDMDVAFRIFGEMPSRDVVSWSTMVSGYSKAGDMEMARVLFEKMPVKNLVSWTVIISGYAEKGFVKDAVELYNQMEETGMKPDDQAIVSILAACAESGMLGLGRRVHDSVERRRYSSSTLMCNALIDMYAKCGTVNQALTVFNRMKNRDIVSWNAMIHGLAIHGLGEKALEFFSRMKSEGFIPDKVTFIGVLCSCTHTGLVDEGICHFYTMERDYGILPEIEHYGCMIDLLGRGGRFKEALRLLSIMPFEPNVKIWGSLLAACRMHKDVRISEEVHDHLLRLDPTNLGNLNGFSNLFAAVGDWGSVANTRLRMKNIGNQKAPGASSIELNDKFHEFTVMDKSHPKSDRIYNMIDGLSQHLRWLGYVQEASSEAFIL